jgi:Zn-dependent M28 family amino/carboxypeptidase
MRVALAGAVTLLTAAALASVKPALLSPGEKAAADTVREPRLRADIRFLAHDLLEGRGPATRGDRLAQVYVAARMEAIGLEPAAPDGTWFQPFDIVGITSELPEVLRVTRGAEAVELRVMQDYVAFSGVQADQARVEDAEIVFVGYGIVAPEHQWDDYKGADLTGKVLLYMNNDPEDDPELFAGKARLYYGRWDYKYEMAARQGAAGAIVIHTTPSAGYGWQVVQSSWSGEQFALPSRGQPEVPVKAWTTEEATRRLAALGGHDLDRLRESAESRDFRPVPLGVRLSLTLRNQVQRKQSANVIGRLRGRDAQLAGQAVIYTAHHDHLGVKQGASPEEDAIYNGALDNASGVATLLAIAEAAVALEPPPRRSLLFAAVGAEEAGLLGSRFLAENPPLAAGRLAANINIDGMNIWGRTKDVVVVGLSKSSLDEWVRALAAAQGREVRPEAFPDKGMYYRSDHFSLAKIGVPATYLDAGTEVVGQPPSWGRRQQEEWEAKHYHQPSDELRPDWNFAGAVEDARLLFWLGVKVANAEALPEWRPGDEFEAARQRALAELAP